MARPRGRPKIVGKYRYAIRYGNPGSLKTEVKNTATETRRFVEKVFRSQDKAAARMCTPDEYAALITTIQAAGNLRDDEDHDFWSVPREFRWSFRWGDQKTMTLEATVSRSLLKDIVDAKPL